jgi:hypothetical protein
MPGWLMQALSIYYQALGSMLQGELARTGAARGDSSSAEASRQLQGLLLSRSFNASVLACAAECVAASYQLVRVIIWGWAYRAWVLGWMCWGFPARLARPGSSREDQLGSLTQKDG